METKVSMSNYVLFFDADVIVNPYVVKSLPV